MWTAVPNLLPNPFFQVLPCSADIAYPFLMGACIHKCEMPLTFLTTVVLYFAQQEVHARRHALHYPLPGAQT